MNHFDPDEYCFDFYEEEECQLSDRRFQQQQLAKMIDAFNANDILGFETALEEICDFFEIQIPAKSARVMFMDYITYTTCPVSGLAFTDDEWDFIYDNLSFIIKCAYELESSRGIKRAIEEIAPFFGVKITEQGE